MVEAKITFAHGGTATVCAGSLIELIRSLNGLPIVALETCEITPDENQQDSRKKLPLAKELKRRAGK